MHFHLTKPQSAFWNLDGKFPLFVGGYGSGKSYVLIARALVDLYEGGDKASVGIYCPTYDLLQLNLIPRFMTILEELGIRYEYNGSRNKINVGERTLIFRSMDNPQRIVAYEVFRSHVDEADLVPADKSEDAWNRIIARNRQNLSDAPNRVHAYTTPEGFSFSYNRWKKAPGEGYQYVRAPTESNPHLDEDYINGLRNSYPAQLVDAYLGGHWVNMTSGAVYPEYDRELNGTRYVPRPKETLHIGMDFNVMKGAAIVHIIRDGLPYAVGEIIDSRDTVATVEAVKELYPGHPIIVYPDASGNSRTSQNATDTDFQVVRDARFRIDAPDANPPIKDRVAAMNAMLCNANGERRYKINADRCPNYALCLEQQAYDKNGMPDKANDLDHPLDAGGYFIHRKYPILKRKAAVKSLGGF